MGLAPFLTYIRCGSQLVTMLLLHLLLPPSTCSPASYLCPSGFYVHTPSSELSQPLLYRGTPTPTRTAFLQGGSYTAFRWFILELFPPSYFALNFSFPKLILPAQFTGDWPCT
ncbi:hypothetical protein HOY80DRAFT_296796 [Tuber brumale]|nr:hypothetical protein HOY80DRAFT_296796 [Tuber brumale]